MILASSNDRERERGEIVRLTIQIVRSLYLTNTRESYTLETNPLKTITITEGYNTLVSIRVGVAMLGFLEYCIYNSECVFVCVRVGRGEEMGMIYFVKKA